MSPDTIRRHLAALQPAAFDVTRALQTLLQRTGPLAPELLALAASLPGLPGVPDGAAQLQAALPALGDLPPPAQTAGAPLTWAEPPAAQVQRAVDAVFAGARGEPVAAIAARASAQVRRHGLQFGLRSQQAGHAAHAAATSLHWLAGAARAGADAERPFNAWEPPGATEHCVLPLALLDGRGRGIAGWLTLWRVHQPGARLCLAPAPASALLLRAATEADIARGATWDAALGTVHDRLHLLLDPAAPGALPIEDDTAIAWDVALPTGQPLGLLQGDSAGAALLLGAAWLLRRHLQPCWRALLLRLWASDLRHTACTAALGRGLDLEPVGGALEKAEGLQPLADLLASQPGAPRLVLHVSRHQPLPSTPLRGVTLEPQPTLLALVQHVVQTAEPLEDAQGQLLDILRQRDPDAEAPMPTADTDTDTDTDTAAAQAWLDLLDTAHRQPATRLRTWLLHCWAEWERELGGRVQQRHVLLQVKPDALGEGHGRLQIDDDSRDTLTGLLARFDGIARHQACTLRGLPGAGKSTLLRHHLQRSAHRLLKALEAVSPSHGGAPAAAVPGPLLPADACELPVYLRLGDLPQALGGAGNTPTARLAVWRWVRDTLQGQGAPQPLLQLLQGQGEWAAMGLHPRLLLDGLNELQVSAPDYRPTRAAMVLDAVHQHLGRPLPAAADAPLPPRPAGLPPPLPFLVASRSDPRIDACGVALLRLDVLPWRPEDVGAYLARRLGARAGAERLAALQQVPNALALCRTPMHLALMCDLWAHGLSVRVDDRATLYAAWLWMRLHRALFPPDKAPVAACWNDPQPDDPAHPAHPGQPGHRQQVLLTADDRAAIQHCLSHDVARLRRLPLQGRLLRALVAQAARQWWADADDGVAGGERSAAPVPWDDLDEVGADGLPRPLVAADLPPALRQRFADACVALGLVQLDRMRGNTWQFSHQSWGEYLASTTLLQGRPGDDPVRDARLLARLQPPPLPGSSDAEHLRSLASQGSTAWQQVPQAVWDELAPDFKPGVDLPLRVPTKDFVEAVSGRPAASQAEVDDWLGQVQRHPNTAVFFQTRILHPDDTTGTVAADLRLWGDLAGTSGKLGLADQGAWRQPAARGAGWQLLLQQTLATNFGRAFVTKVWNDLLPRLLADAGCPTNLLAQLQAEQGRLEPAPQADGAEVLGLALCGLGSAAAIGAWLQWLLLHGAWPALHRVLPVLRDRLEPEDPALPADALPRAWREPDPGLHWLRRVLLLTSVDAGAAALPGLQAGGLLALLDAPWPVAMPQPLLDLWNAQIRPAAFTGSGRRLAHRLQAGLMLGWLGDTLRYEPRPVPGPPGPPGQPPQRCLRPVRGLWAAVGAPVGPTAFTIGSPAGDGHADERPQWTAALGGFLACRLPLTVAEWQLFHASPAGRQFRWGQQHDPDYTNPLQPVTGISWHAASAYARWADGCMADWQQAESDAGWPPLQHALPTEVQWDAAVRGPRHAPGAGATGWVAVDPTAFNHAPTRWGRPSPVGVFSASATPLGLQDAAGNTWDWCSNAVNQDQLDRGWRDVADRDAACKPAKDDAAGMRALRGGAFRNATGNCRPAYRSHGSPGVDDGGIGVRLVRCWLPHS